MAEETEGQDVGAEAAAGGKDPAAMALALNGASREDAGAFLKKQGALIDDQRHHLREQFKQLRLGIWEKRLGVLLRAATAIVGIAVAAGVAFVIWDAAHSNQLLIDSFSIPPDLTARGITGEVVASRLLGRLSVLQAQSSTQRAAQSFTNDWGQDDIKVEIPDTGISLGELDRFLRAKLGHDIHITGEVVRGTTDLNLTARVGSQPAGNITGQEAELDTLLQKLAESIYGVAQPYRYGVYLASHGRVDEAIAVYAALARTGPESEQRWAYVGWNNAIAARDGAAARLRLVNKALTLDPDFIPALANLQGIERIEGHTEAAIRVAQKIISIYPTSAGDVFEPAQRKYGDSVYQARIAVLLGAFHDSNSVLAVRINSGVLGQTGLSAEVALSQAGEHDLSAARATMANMIQDSGVQPGIGEFTNLTAMMQIASQAEDWPEVLSQARIMRSLYASYPGARYYDLFASSSVAIAQAKLGEFAGAETTIAPTPADCYPCLLARAQVAEIAGQHARADWWSSRAVHSNPSIPVAESEWGEALLARGDAAGAIAKFTLANRKGPHFADPLEGWGEALMAQNRSDLALAKFAEAEKYAPNWGRLHLKWGEALGYAGKPDEAKKQYAIAATLDLTAAEKSELMREHD